MCLDAICVIPKRSDVRKLGPHTRCMTGTRQSTPVSVHLSMLGIQHPSPTENSPFNSFATSSTWWTFRIFSLFFLLWGGEGGIRGARKARGRGFILLKIPGNGGVSLERGWGGGRVSVGNLGGGA